MKRLIIFGLLLLLLTACNVSDKKDSIELEEDVGITENEAEENTNESSNETEKETKNPETTIESKQVEKSQDEQEEKEEKEEAEKEETDKKKETAKKETEKSNKKKEVDKAPETSQPEKEEKEEKEAEEKKEEKEDDILSEAEFEKISRAIIDAQLNEDFDKISKMSTEDVVIKEDKKTLTFKSVTYPHEQEILTNEKATDIEYRYYHVEDEQTVIVGFAARDEENDYSYTIDFTFLLIDGEWKMNDMDRNK